MNHKQTQDSGAPAPHTPRTTIIITIIPSFVLPFRRLSGCCQNGSSLSEERSARAGRTCTVRPAGFSQQASHAGEALQVRAFLCRLRTDDGDGKDCPVNEDRKHSRTFEAQDGPR